MMVTSFLHLHHHLSHTGSNLLLRVMKKISTTIGILTPDISAPVTLNTIFRNLGWDDIFRVHPMCPSCKRVYPANSPPDLECPHCSIPLFDKKPRAKSGNDAPPRAKPRLQCPQNPISDSILRFLWQDDNEKVCDEWRREAPTPGKTTRIQDGDIWKTLPDPTNNRPFFDNDAARPDADELRIGVTLGFDGWVVYAT